MLLRTRKGAQMIEGIPKDRRNKYRVEPEAPPFELKLVLPNMHLLAGEILDVSADGTALSVPARKCPKVSLDDILTLQLTLPQTGGSLLLEGRVRGVGEYERKRLVRLQFTSPGSLLGALDNSLFRYFNRRSALRMPPPEDERVAVTVSWPGGEAEGQIVDLSTTGMAVLFQDDPGLEDDTSVTVEFRLPDCRHPIRLDGRMKYALEVSAAMRRGIQFDPEGSEDSLRMQGAIAGQIQAWMDG